MRGAIVWLHRWVGLLMAGFLIIEGVTGSLLAFRGDIERLISPELFATPQPGVPTMELSKLAEHASAAAPQAGIWYFNLGRDQAVFRVFARTDPSTGKPYDFPYNHTILDPWTGKELGRVRDGGLFDGWVHFMPFIFDLHMSLAAGNVGSLVLGIVALAWTIDCFIGIYLTFPVVLARFLARWWPAWKIKMTSNALRVHFDLHRASGLWLWPLLFVLAWSSVMFNLRSVYVPVTAALFDFRSEEELMETTFSGRRANPIPRLDWAQAQAVGNRLLAQEAIRRGITVGQPFGMAYIDQLGLYSYSASSNLDIQEMSWNDVGVMFDGDTGALVEVGVPSGERAGNTIESWLRALHFANLRGWLAFRILVCVAGLVIAMLSWTGIYLWWKKRRARRHRRAEFPAGEAAPLFSAHPDAP